LLRFLEKQETQGVVNSDIKVNDNSEIKEVHLTIRSVEKIFTQACKRAKITKKVTVHSLRYSFAAHLLENGIDLRYIQELLSHKGSTTTEIYTRVSNKDIGLIRNPLDTILNNGTRNEQFI
jgi:integrase/recombinase XerD